MEESDLLVDLSHLTEEQMSDVCNELKTGHQKRMVDAEINQRRLANENYKDHRSVDGIGRLVARFDLDGYMSNFVRKGETVRDKEYLDWVLKRHPEVRVNSGGTKTQVGYRG